MTETNFTVPSSDGIHTLAGVVYLPECEPIGYFHIVHGMTEHIARYRKLMSAMAEIGYICFGYDNLGHGYTAKDESELGYIAQKDGYELLARDVKVFSDAVISKYGAYGKELPYYLMGHSMGSFITRYAITKYVQPDKYIIMGTAGSNPAAGAALLMISLLKKLYGDRHISPFMDKMGFGSYNKPFGGGTADDPSPWLSSDKTAREKYYADPFCTFKFTLSAMEDLVRLIKCVNSKEWYQSISKTMPILLLSGDMDPVGSLGKGVREVAQKLKANGANADCILYPDARHEILNDFCYEQVKADIIEFLNR